MHAPVRTQRETVCSTNDVAVAPPLVETGP